MKKMEKPKVINGLTFEMAQTMVNGSKWKALNRFKRFASAAMGIEDMAAEADIAIMRAWEGWDPEVSQFNTYATNMLNWHMYRMLDTYHPVFQMNVKTKNDLRARGETFASIKKAGKTQDEEFNAQNELNGKTEFTREMWNSYVYFQTTKTFGSGIQSVRNACEYDEEEGFNILDQASTDNGDGVTPVQKFHWLNDSKQFGKIKQRVVQMLLDGHSLDIIAKEIGMTKYALAKKFGGLDLREEKEAVEA